MEIYAFYNNGRRFERITKAKARTAFLNGLTVLLAPSKMYPYTECGEFKLDGKGRDKNAFDRITKAYEHAYCSEETGRYAAFYIPTVDVDRFTGETPTYNTMGTVRQYDYSFLD